MKKKNESILGLWARKSVIADRANKVANEIMLANYLLGFV
jgi:hypothetical protein